MFAMEFCLFGSLQNRLLKFDLNMFVLINLKVNVNYFISTIHGATTVNML